MSKVLFIVANPKENTTSFSLQVAERFIKQYKQANPEDEIKTIDVYKEDIPFLDGDVFSAWGALGSGAEFGSLSESEQTKVAKLNSIVDEYIEADKYIFVSPMWNFSLPPKLKAYIDAIMIAGKTFKYTESGPVGLLNGKKALHIQASGGIYSEGAFEVMDHGHKYLRAVQNFLGVKEVHGLLVEGTNLGLQSAEEQIADAFVKADALALAF